MSPKNSQASRFNNEKAAWFVLAVSLAITFLSGYIAKVNTEARALERFNNELSDAVNLIDSRLHEYEQVLIGGVSFFNTLGEEVLTREKWRSYVEGLQIERNYPGIQGMGFAKVLKPQDVFAHERQVQADGFPLYRVNPPGIRDIYTSIVYLEPFDWRNQRAFGYDMYSESNRRDAMSRARDTGEASITNKVTLVQETDTDVQPGFLMYLPLYESGATPTTTEERRQSLIGYVYSPFRMHNLMDGILRTDKPNVDFALYDGPATALKSSLLYTSSDSIGVDKSRSLFTATQNIELAGHSWRAEFYSTPVLQNELNVALPYYIIMGGILVDAMLFLIILSMANQRHQINRAVDEATEQLRNKKETLELAKASGQMGVWDYDFRTDKLIWDDKVYELLDVSPEKQDLGFIDWQNCVHPDDINDVMMRIDKARINKNEFNDVFRTVRQDGSILYIEAHALFTYDASGNAIKMTGLNYDVTAEIRVNERLSLAASVYQHAQEALVITDVDQRIVDVNPSFALLTGYAKKEVLDKNPWSFCKENDSTALINIQGLLESEKMWKGELSLVTKAGKSLSMLVSIAHVPGETNAAQYYIYSFNDISDLKDQQRQLQHAAHYDALTQLPNRALMADRLMYAMAHADRNKKLLAVCFFDLDNFKEINDTYGHAMGDEVLVKVAGRVRHLLRDTDSASRIGGDEFILLLSNIVSLEDCEEGLNRITNGLNAPYHMKDGSVFDLTVSIGVTLYPQDNADADTLIRHADQTMYLAKQAGRNCFRFFDMEQERIAEQHRLLLTTAQGALMGGQFLLYYQPQVDMLTGAIVGMEALIRWQHAERGLLPPVEFLPVIEKNALAEMFDEWVVETTFQQQLVWEKDGLDIPISINIMGYTLQNQAIYKILQNNLKKYPGINPGNIVLEITETMALQNLDQVRRVVQQCRDLGFKIALDDFGTGYSSLSHLKKMPVDSVKIDRVFIHDLSESKEDQMFVQGIIDLAKAFKCRIVAEGVEGVPQGVKLLELGCHIAQGYGVAKPMPKSQVNEWITSYQTPTEWQNLDRKKTG